MSDTEKKSRTGFFSKKKPQVVEENDMPHSKEHDDAVEDDIQAALVVEEPPPASFTSLFRFANHPKQLPFPLTSTQVYNAFRVLLGLCRTRMRCRCRCSSGVCYNKAFTRPIIDCHHQPLMSLIFGNLTQQFINFQMTLELNSSPESIAAAANAFRKAASEDASYLVYIGELAVFAML